MKKEGGKERGKEGRRIEGSMRIRKSGLCILIVQRDRQCTVCEH